MGRLIRFGGGGGGMREISSERLARALDGELEAITISCNRVGVDQSAAYQNISLNGGESNHDSRNGKHSHLS